MRMNKIFVIVPVVAAACLSVDGSGVQDSKKGKTPAPIPVRSFSGSVTDIAASSPAMTPQEKVLSDYETLKEAQKVRAEYLDPIFQEILSHPVNCAELEDNQEAYNEFLSIFKSKEHPEKFIPFWEERFYSPHSGRHDPVTPEMERQIQEYSKGHICFSFANSYTLSKLRDVWKKYPCSRSTPVALLQIRSILKERQYLSVIPKPDGETISPFKDEIIALEDYIMTNYKNTWYAGIAEARSSKSFSEGPTSDYRMEVLSRTISQFEKDQVWNDRYYMSFFSKNKSDDLYSYYTYKLAGIYLQKCNIAIAGGNDKEAVDLYEKHFQLRSNLKKNMPRHYLDMKHTPACYKYVEEYHPEIYQRNP